MLRGFRDRAKESKLSPKKEVELMEAELGGVQTGKRRRRGMGKMTREMERRESWGRQGRPPWDKQRAWGWAWMRDSVGVCLGRQGARQKCWGEQRALQPPKLCPTRSEMLHGSLTPPISTSENLVLGAGAGEGS